MTEKFNIWIARLAGGIAFTFMSYLGVFALINNGVMDGYLPFAVAATVSSIIAAWEIFWKPFLVVIGQGLQQGLKFIVTLRIVRVPRRL